ncbi:MAG: threonine dehydratase [Verrucomicrobia bacterium]|nr:threonine dehydratase [Verrucomicrobiota bacterium]
MESLPTLADLEAATTLVRAAGLPATPQFSWPLLNTRAGCEVWVKHENHTPLGAFKVRGGLVYFDWLGRALPGVRGVIAATRGNHGQSVAFAARRHGLRVVIVVPHGNSTEKNAAMRALGAELVEHGADFQAALDHARGLAAAQSLHLVPSFDRRLVAGVGTLALEFLRGAPPLDTVYVPIGLGSGICGLMAVRDALGLATKIVGVVSARAPAYALSFVADRAIEHEATTRIADGVACRATNADALRHIRHGVERIVAVDDDAVEAAMRVLFSDTHNVAEGAGAIALAAVLQERTALAGRRVGVVLTGGNVDRATFARVLAAP